MNSTIEQYLINAERFDEVVATEGAVWTAPSPCSEWTAAGVFDHVVETQRDFLLGRGAQLGQAPTGTPGEVWAAHVGAVAAVGADDAFVTATYDGYFGPTTVADTLRDFYGFDLVVHRWDLGRALGVEVAWSEDEMDLLESAMAGFGPALHSEGVCGPAIEMGDDASRQVRILGQLGRRA
ncbi:TIGR03086 family metal-binding protein [soil metagenome]